MPAATAKTQSIYLVGGTDEFSIKETAAKLAEKLAPKSGEFGVEIIEGAAANQDDALRILARVKEALTTVGLFGADKLVWLKNTNLLADERGVTAEAVKDALTDLADLLKQGLPAGVRLLISALGCDRRKALYKTIEKTGAIQFFEALDDSKEADEDIAEFIQRRLTAEKKSLNHAGFELFRELVAPNLREIANELEKLCLYVGARAQITETDVRAICSASRQAVIWELTDSLGARSLRRSLAALDNLLANGEAPLGIVSMLSAQFRFMLLMKDLMTRRLIQAGENAGLAFVKAFEALPASATAHFPKTKEGKNPSPWRLYRCALAAKHYSQAELIAAMDVLLLANLQLVSTQLDERLVLEQAVVKIAGPARAVAPRSPTPAG
jgi:DNA polymerase-3 subunit delta